MIFRTDQTSERDQGGFALAAVIFVMALLAVLAITGLGMTADARLASHGVREGTRAFYAAEAGVNLVMANWDSLQYDTLMAAPGDSVDLGWETIPENGCTYRAVLQRVDDGGSGGPLYYVKVAGRSEGSLGGERTLGAMLTNSSVQVPGVLFGGTVEISGSPTITGDCGAFHSNGDITKGAKNLTMDGEMTAAGSTIEQGPYLDTDSIVHTPTTGADSVPIPQMNPLDYCPGDADWIMRNQYVVEVATGDSLAVGSDAWNASWNTGPPPGFYELGKSATPQGGVLCVMGNIELSGGAGADGAPIDMSIIATGSVQLTGTSFINAVHPDGIAILAGGDLEMSGSSGTLSDNFEGLVWVGAQCDISGEAKLNGQIICADNTNPVGSIDLPPFANEFSGSITLNFGCGGSTSTSIAILAGSWMELFR